MYGDVLGASSHLSITGLESLRLLLIPRVAGKRPNMVQPTTGRQECHLPMHLSLLTEEGTLRRIKLRMYPITQDKLNFSSMPLFSRPPCFPKKSVTVSTFDQYPSEKLNSFFFPLPLDIISRL